MAEKKERLLYFPFEYSAFKPHFEQQAQRGWKIKEIKGNWLWSTLVYETCVPQEITFYTDFSVNSQYYINTKAEDNDPYHAFVEDYGYQYICGFKGLVVYASKKEKIIELRDNNQETKKELRKATCISVRNFLYCAIVELVIIFGGFHITTNMVSSNQGLLRLASYGVVLLGYVVALMPVFRHLVYEKKTYPIGAIQRRTTILFASLAFWVCCYITDQIELTLLLYSMGISLLVISTMKFKIDSKKPIALLALYGGTLLFWLVVYFGVSTYSSSFRQTLHVYQPPLTKESLHIQSDAPVELKSQESPLCRYISAEYDDDGFYSYAYIKDTAFKEYLVKKLPYEFEVIKKEKRSSYTIYDRVFDVVIVKGQTLLELDKNLYNQMSDKGIDALFKQLANIE